MGRTILFVRMFRVMLLCFVSGSVFMSAQQQGDDDVPVSCEDVLRNVLKNRATASDTERAFRRVITMRTITRQTGFPDTVIRKVESLETESVQALIFDSAEVWTSERDMVLVNRVERTVTFVDLRDAGKLRAGQKRVNGMLPDSLMDHASRISCEVVSGGGRADSTTRSVIDVAPEMRQFYNAQRITLEFRSDNEIRRFVVVHPPGGPSMQTEYIVEELSRDYVWQVPEDLRLYFLDEHNELKDEYHKYRMILN